MSGKIILDLAISLDGFIADLDGGFAWIGGQDDKSLDTNEQHGFVIFSTVWILWLWEKGPLSRAFIQKVDIQKR